MPRNARLAAVDATTAAGAAWWDAYSAEWGRMNHVRALASLIAAILP